MQTRDRRVRGLDLHLARLTSAHREMFAEELDEGRVRDHLRTAMEQSPPDASVRVHVQRPDGLASPAVAVIVRPAQGVPGGPTWRLKSVPYQRSIPHIKHIGDFGQAYHGDLVRRDGYDEALLTAPDGTIAEGSITNVGFFDGSAVVWPDAPQLAGITMQLLQRSLPHRRSRITLADLAAYPAAFATNARGIAAVRAIDGHTFAVDERLMRTLTEAYDAVPWEKP
jgi:branched-subunit amino acid aminotransferase/4-amino-4-deoxychorismate lyase